MEKTPSINTSPTIEKSPFREFKESLVITCRNFAESPIVNGVTSFLTIYALFGDDIRTATTSKEVDIVFNVATIVSTSIFAIELIACSIGQDGYFGGFFFYLDLVSTLTLVLDLTWISEALTCGGGLFGEQSKAGRAGARATRTVRVIRLLRIVKLYKMYEAWREKRKLRKLAEARAKAKAEEDDLDEDEEPEVVEQEEDADEADEERARRQEENAADMQIGKKLGDMTTRRVIVIVLFMLFLVPQFNLASTSIVASTEFQTSSDLVASMLYERFRKWCPLKQTVAVDLQASDLPECLQSEPSDSSAYTEDQKAYRRLFERYMIDQIYYFHEGGASFFNKLYWIGVQSKTLSKVSELEEADSMFARLRLGRLMQIGQERYLGREGIVPTDEWDTEYDAGDQHRQPLPEATREVLVLPWQEDCYDHVGVPLSGERARTSCSITEHLRCSEVDVKIPKDATDEEKKQWSFMFVFDKRRSTVTEAQLSILQTLFICIAVGLGSVTFSSDAAHLLLIPIGQMLAKLETFEKSPLEAINMGDIEFRRSGVERKKNQEELARKGWLLRFLRRFRRKPHEPMETIVLEKTIIKLGGVLAEGFGEEGANIVKPVLRGENSTELCPKSSATELLKCIVGVATIRAFDKMLVALDVRIGEYVNQIAEIVHGICDEYNGTTTCNYGGSFLMIWRVSLFPQSDHKKLADMAMLSIIKMAAETKKSLSLAAFREHPHVSLLLGSSFTPCVDFGMHAGSALECVIGSAFKLDVVYISNTVKIATQVASEAWHYGVHVLMTSCMYNYVGTQMKQMSRAIDVVLLRDSKRPLQLRTIDLDFSVLSKRVLSGTRTISNRYRWRQVREEQLEAKWSEEYDPMQEFLSSVELSQMRYLYTPDFFLRFDTGFRNYVAGQWHTARDMLVTCRFSPDRFADTFVNINEDQWPADGPTQELLKYMATHGNVAPQSWPGFRRL